MKCGQSAGNPDQFHSVWGSSETVRQTASRKFRWEERMRQSELHGDMESTAETIVPREITLQVIASRFHGVTKLNGPKVVETQPPAAVRSTVHLAICWKV